MIYLRAGLQPGTFDLMIADADGENEQVYDSGKISNLRWSPEGDRFAYDKDGDTGFGRRGDKPNGEYPVQRAIFLAKGVLVFTNDGELNSKALDGNVLTTIAYPFPADAPFDAVVAP